MGAWDLLAAVAYYNRTDGQEGVLYFVTGVARHESRPAITLPLLSPSAYPLSIYPPLIVPLLTCFVITTVETLGDVTATAEASQLSVDGSGMEERVQGGLLADGVSTWVACALTSLPTTTMSQNNGVIAMTRCASRRVGYVCSCWLLLFGAFSDLSALMTSVPNCVLGGMMTMLFSQVKSQPAK